VNATACARRNSPLKRMREFGRAEKLSLNLQ
jgi:hypothetical protein